MRNQSGFTLVEILMVVLLVAILAAVSIPQFVDFRTEAKDSAAAAAVGALRSAIANQYANITLRCGAAPGTFPTAAQINANDVTTGGNPCSTAEVAVATDRQFVVGAIPDNPWGGAAVKNTVTACTGAATGCAQADNTGCTGVAYVAADSGWCYNPANGQIWANSQNSTGPKKENLF